MDPRKISSVLNIWSLPCHHISLPQSFQASKLGKLCIWAHHRISWEGFTHFPTAGIKQLSWEGIKPTRKVIKFSICLRSIHTEATMSQREQRKLLFLSSRSQRNWMQACNINILQTEDLAITFQIAWQSQKKLAVGDPQFWRYQKVQFLLWGLPARTKMNVGPIGRK